MSAVAPMNQIFPGESLDEKDDCFLLRLLVPDVGNRMVEAKVEGDKLNVYVAEPKRKTNQFISRELLRENSDLAEWILIRSFYLKQKLESDRVSTVQEGEDVGIKIRKRTW